MEEPNLERRLAAVLAADVVGYSRLMEVDEAGTLARLKTVRLELIDPAIARCKGRIIKTTGDGMLVEFQSEPRRCAARWIFKSGWLGAIVTCPRRAPSFTVSALIWAT